MVYYTLFANTENGLWHEDFRNRFDAIAERAILIKEGFEDVEIVTRSTSSLFETTFEEIETDERFY